MSRLYGLVLVSSMLIAMGWAVQAHRPEPMVRLGNRWLSNYPLISTGPLKGPFVSFCWVKAQRAGAEYRFEDVYRISALICHMQPFIPEIWDFQSWNMSFNLAVECQEDRGQMFRWVTEGIEQLNEGLRFNPDDPLLHFGIGWTIFMKTRGDFSFEKELEEYFEEPPMLVACRHFLMAKAIERGEFWKAVFIVRTLEQNQMHEEADRLWELVEKNFDKRLLQIEGYRQRGSEK
ncbi:MAG: hypothetical protein HQL31_00460 [Planctomycetes bacterium]|nr:hypothetical protein [Planctomycetota bacterium]